MTLLQNIIYGFISGITEFLPVSSHAHQSLLNRIFGADAAVPIKGLLMRIAVLLALLTACRSMISRLRKEKAMAKRSRRGHTYALKGLYDIRLIRTATLPLLAGLLFLFVTGEMSENLLILTLILIINGIIILLPEHMRQANKDARAMTGLDGILIGTAGALSAVPGISRIGAVLSAATMRGADRNHAMNWALILSIPAVLLMIIVDITKIVAYGFSIASFSIFIGYSICAVFAFIGARLGIVIIRYLTSRTGFAWFAYYSWGMALFTFILYLMT